MCRAMGRAPSSSTASSSPESRTSRNPSRPRRSRAACGMRWTPSAAMERILVIEDDALLRGAIRIVLESAGYEVLDAADGDAGLRLHREQGADLVVVDRYMPERHGLGVIRDARGLGAAAGSRRGGPGHTTIAGHVHHLTSSLALSTRGLRGESTSRDRSGSWTVSAVDDAEWAALRARLHDEYATLFVAVETHARWDEDALAVAIGAIAHTAYHLGAIRQRLPARRRGSARAIKG